jgi:hypothetical protein
MTDIEATAFARGIWQECLDHPGDLTSVREKLTKHIRTRDSITIFAQLAATRIMADPKERTLKPGLTILFARYLNGMPLSDKSEQMWGKKPSAEPVASPAPAEQKQEVVASSQQDAASETPPPVATKPDLERKDSPDFALDDEVQEVVKEDLSEAEKKRVETRIALFSRATDECKSRHLTFPGMQDHLVGWINSLSDFELGVYSTPENMEEFIQESMAPFFTEPQHFTPTCFLPKSKLVPEKESKQPRESASSSSSARPERKDLKRKPSADEEEQKDEKVKPEAKPLFQRRRENARKSRQEKALLKARAAERDAEETFDVLFNEKHYDTPPPPHRIRNKASPKHIYHTKVFTPFLDGKGDVKDGDAYLNELLKEKKGLDDDQLAKMIRVNKSNLASNISFDMAPRNVVQNCQQLAREKKETTQQANKDAEAKWLARVPGIENLSPNQQRQFAIEARAQWKEKQGKARRRRAKKAPTPKRHKKCKKQKEEEEKEEKEDEAEDSDTETDKEGQKKMAMDEESQDESDADVDHHGVAREKPPIASAAVSEDASIDEAMNRMAPGMSSSSSSSSNPSRSPTNALDIHILAAPPRPTLSKEELAGHQLRH